MEENPGELNSLSAKTFSYLTFLSSDPLFSSIITLYTLILLYFPQIFLRIIFSPILISTGILLLILLRLGAIQRAETDKQFESTNENHKWVESEIEIEAETELGFTQSSVFIDSFVEWNVRAPLEVIYEAYEGDEEDEEHLPKKNPNEKEETRLERYPSLALYYHESDTDTSSDGDFTETGDLDSPENRCYRWDEEDRDGLIEIALDGKRISDFNADEDNMIEIDISPTRSGDRLTPARHDGFTGEVSDSANL